jgi:hypothetical protein
MKQHCYECERALLDTHVCERCGFDNSIIHGGKRLAMMTAIVILPIVLIGLVGHWFGWTLSVNAPQQISASVDLD